MKTRLILSLLLITLLLGGCFVASFYPLYTPSDLHPDTLMAGKWLDEDSTVWYFDYVTLSEKDQPTVTDSTGYYLTFQEKGKEPGKSSLEIRVVRLEGLTFLDFFIHEVKREEYPDFFDLHTLPIHTFAKVTLEKDTLHLNWLNPEWLSQLEKEKKLKIRYLKRSDDILLTAPSKDLQKFVIRYAGVPAAWEKGTSFKLTRTSW